MTDTFALIDDGCWKLISQFAAPPDGMLLQFMNYHIYFGSYLYLYCACCHLFYPVYNLALSSKHFFGDIPASDEIERGAICQVHGLQSGKILRYHNYMSYFSIVFVTKPIMFSILNFMDMGSFNY